MPGTLIPPTGVGGLDESDVQEIVAGFSFSARDGRLGASLTKLGVVLDTGSGAWDEDLVESPTILRDPKSGRYAMVHTGYGDTSGATRGQIGLAWSDDLIHWTKVATPILAHSGTGGAPDQNGCTGPLLLWDAEGEQYVLYYIGLTATGYEGGTKRLCYATAIVLTGPWTRHGAVVSPSGATWREEAIWHPSIVERNGTWYLFFNATGNTNVETIGYATAPSITGPWTVDDVNSPLLNVVNGTWEEDIVGDPSVRRVGDFWVMDYFGYDGSSAGDGIAVTTDADFPLGWVRHPDNPTLTPGPDTFDAKYAHKPFVLIDGGEVFHFYTAVAEDDHRCIALAVTAPSIDPASGSDLSTAPTVTGALVDGTALQSLLDSLATLGLNVVLDGSVIFADDFNRADGAPGADWTAAGGSGFAVLSNELKWTGTSDGLLYHDSGESDAYAIEYTVEEVNGTYPLGFIVRADSAHATSWIKVFRQNGTGWKLLVNSNGTSVTRGGSSPAPVAGDVIRIEVSGTTVTLFHNDVQQAQWTSISAYSTGTFQGIAGSANSVLRLDNFSVAPL